MLLLATLRTLTIDPPQIFHTGIRHITTCTRLKAEPTLSSPLAPPLIMSKHRAHLCHLRDQAYSIAAHRLRNDLPNDMRKLPI